MNCKLTEVSNEREQIVSLTCSLIFKVTECILNNAKFDSAVQINYALWAIENFNSEFYFVFMYEVTNFVCSSTISTKTYERLIKTRPNCSTEICIYLHFMYLSYFLEYTPKCKTLPSSSQKFRKEDRIFCREEIQFLASGLQRVKTQSHIYLDNHTGHCFFIYSSPWSAYIIILLLLKEPLYFFLTFV